MADQEIGKVIHYYDKAMVGVVRLSKNVKKGDKIKVVKGDDDFELTVDSMQLDHEPIEKGKSKEEIAIKFPSPTKEGAVVYRID